MKWQASQPANIALIKYMGKTDATINLPCNASLSYTLEHCRTFITLEYQQDLTCDEWQPLIGNHLIPVDLSEKSKKKFLNHLQHIKKFFNSDANFIIRSANNFPADCGLASSASSFAALTEVACQALAELTNKERPDIFTKANLSRQGSGSSCRSFFSPWAIWAQDEVYPADIHYTNLWHQVVIVAQQKKAISSSSAHQLVTTSDLFIGRPERADKRLASLLTYFQQNNWQAAYHLVWQEFQDMHALFATSKEPFSYITPETLMVLQIVQTYWEQFADGPLVTLDAGPNVHLLYRNDQFECAKKIALLLKDFSIIKNYD